MGNSEIYLEYIRTASVAPRKEGAQPLWRELCDLTQPVGLDIQNCVQSGAAARCDRPNRRAAFSQKFFAPTDLAIQAKVSSPAFIAPPQKINPLLRFFIWIADKAAGKKLLPPRLLAWAPKVALASGILEAAATKPEGRLTPRLLKLLRLQVSFSASCAFCYDMNSVDYASAGLTAAEVQALQRLTVPQKIRSLSAAERAALQFAREVTATPIAVTAKTVVALRSHFSEREYLLIAATCAQVNYWARFMQGLGVPPAGFSDHCASTPLSF